MDNDKKQDAEKNLQKLCSKSLEVCNELLHKDVKKVVLLGITGGVAAGKSTLGRYVQQFLIENLPKYRTVMISTDSFIFSNAYLQSKSLLQRKGFPESFAWQDLKKFIEQIKGRRHSKYKIPLYFHEKKDIVAGCLNIIEQADIYIVEGINLLFNYIDKDNVFCLRDYLDFSIYLNTNVTIAKQRAVHRFHLACQQTQNQSIPYFDSLKALSSSQLTQYIENLWENINTSILNNYIAPHRDDVDMVVNDLPELYNGDPYPQ